MFVSTAPPPPRLPPHPPHPQLIGIDKQMPKTVWLRLPLSEKSYSHKRKGRLCKMKCLCTKKKQKKKTVRVICVGGESCPHFICGRFFKWLRRCCSLHLDSKQWFSYTSKRALSLYASPCPTLTKPLSRKSAFFSPSDIWNRHAAVFSESTEGQTM